MNKFNFFINLMSNNEIKNRVFTLFEFKYNLNEDVIKNYEIGKIDYKKIGLEHIKVSGDMRDNILSELKLGKFRLDKYKNDTIRLIRYHESFPTLVKISPYKSDKDINNMLSEPNRDSFFSFLFSEKVLENKINLVELPILNIDVEYGKLKNMINGYPELENIEELIGDKKISKTLSVRMRERFFKSKSLLEHLESDSCSLRDILFQVALTLGQIQHYYPKFKHNNLDLSQINIYYKKDKGVVKTYNIGNDIYTYKSPGFELKIGNFEKSSLEPIIKNKENKNDLIMLAKNILDSKVFGKINCDDKCLELIKKISGMNNSMDSIEPISPQKILNSVMDKSLKNTRKINTQKNSHDYYLGKKTIKVKGKLSKEFGKVDFINKKIKRRFKNKKQTGGASFKPSMKNDPNNPNLSNDQRMTYKKYQADKLKPREPPVLAEQKIYQPTQGPPKKQNPLMYPPVFVPTKHPTYNMTVPYQPWQYEVNKMPIQNVYNISLADPRGDHSRLARVYENMTPGKEFGLSSTSITERIQSSDYISSIMINRRNGMDLSLTGGEGSLLEHIKLMEINPYHYNNPYESMPEDFLLYTSAYPIRYDSERERIRLAKNSVGLNLRLHKLTREALRAHASSGFTEPSQHKPWRELEMYKKINNIIKNKQSPNFVKMHFWVIDRDSRINYEEISKIQSKKLIYDQRLKQRVEEDSLYKGAIDKKINDIISEDNRDKFRKEYLGQLRMKVRNANLDDEFKKDVAQAVGFEKNVEHLNPIIDLLKEESFAKEDSKVTLGIITESPTSTFIQWATPVYSGGGSLKTMNQTGFHTYEEYESLLFQYIHAFSVLQEQDEKIGFKDFKPETNLFVKDIYHDDRDKKHWRYVVDGLEYFVPNYGHVALIDSWNNYVLSSEDKIFEDFKKLIDPNFYTGSWRKNHGHKVPDKFIELVKKLNNMAKDPNPETDIKVYLKQFTNLLNNRVGEKVTQNEMKNIDLTRFPSELKPGTLVAMRDTDSYKWALVMEKLSSDQLIQKYNILLDLNGNKKDVSSALLNVTNDTVEPLNKKGVKYDSYNMIERYNY